MAEGSTEFANPDSPTRSDVNVPSIPGQTVEGLAYPGYPPKTNQPPKTEVQQPQRENPIARVRANLLKIMGKS